MLSVRIISYFKLRAKYEFSPLDVHTFISHSVPRTNLVKRSCENEPFKTNIVDPFEVFIITSVNQ